MSKIFIKSLILSTCIVLFGFQTLVLWSHNYSENTFINRTSDNEIIEVQNKNYLLISDSVEVFYEEDHAYSIGRITQDYNEIYEEALYVILHILNSGQISSQYSKGDIDELTPIVYELELPLNKALFADEFGADINDLSDINYIHSIGLGRSEDGNQIILYLGDYSMNSVVYYELDDESVMDSFEIIEDLEENIKDKKYSQVEIIDQGDREDIKRITAPLPSESLVFDIDLLFEVPYINEKGINVEELDGFVNGFFENSAVKWVSEKDENRIEYGDDSVIIRYSSNGLFEYSKIVSDIDVSINISDAYNIVEEFLSRDKDLIDMEKILKGYTIDGKNMTLYYDYSQGDFPIIMGSELQEKYGMDYPIVVTVGNQTVTSYKRVLVQREDFMPQKIQLESNYEDILNRFIDDYSIDKTMVDDMYLAYYYKTDNYLEMKWIIEYKGTMYVYNAF